MKKKYKAKRKFPFFSAFLVFLIIFLIYFFFFSSVFRVKKININSSFPEVNLLVKRNIYRKIGFWNVNNIFLFNKKNISQELKQFIKIKSFRIKRKLPNTLLVETEKRKTALICCLEDNCFKIDKEGMVFAQTIEKSNLHCPVYQTGERAMKEKIVNNILEIKKELKDYLGKLYLENNSLTLETHQGWRVFFNLENNIKNQIFRLKTVLREVIDEPQKLDYIDLRYKETIYFK